MPLRYLSTARADEYVCKRGGANWPRPSCYTWTTVECLDTDLVVLVVLVGRLP